MDMYLGNGSIQWSTFLSGFKYDGMNIFNIKNIFNVICYFWGSFTFFNQNPDKERSIVDTIPAIKGCDLCFPGFYLMTGDFYFQCKHKKAKICQSLGSDKQLLHCSSNNSLPLFWKAVFSIKNWSLNYTTSEWFTVINVYWQLFDYCIKQLFCSSWGCFSVLQEVFCISVSQ